MQYVDSWYCWRKENILQLCFFVSTLPSTIFDWRYFTTILPRNIFPDIWSTVFGCNIAEKFVSWCLIDNISAQCWREIFVLMFDWKYFANKYFPSYLIERLLLQYCRHFFSWYLMESISVRYCIFSWYLIKNIAEKYFYWYLNESILLQYRIEIFCQIFDWKYFRAILQWNIFTDILLKVFCVENFFSPDIWLSISVTKLKEIWNILRPLCWDEPFQSSELSISVLLLFDQK